MPVLLFSLVAPLLTFFNSAIAAKNHCDALTFAERVIYQRAIEEVYWRHRIWPKENPRPKPPLEAIISERALEQKVEDYLGKSQVVADQRGWPITATELQAEMERMAGHTRQPDVLRELFAALGHDPYLIAECLARPILAQRLLAERKGGSSGPLLDDKSNRKAIGNPSPSTLNLVARGAADPSAIQTYNVGYKLPQISSGCTDDTWTATTTVNAPDVRADHTVVWTGSEMIIWGGFNYSPPYFLNTGGKYDPATDSWTATSTTNAPTGRDFQTAVWTGTEIVVWGGYNGKDLNSGGRYNPPTNSWVATSTANAPLPRERHSAVWTGSEVIIWGGRDNTRWFNSGGRYDPITDAWSATSTINAPEARWAHSVEWTGSEMIVWGGTNETIHLNTGGRYNPGTDSWVATNTATAPLGKYAHTAVWTGSEMIVWGGVDSTFSDTDTGGRYDPTEDSWVPTSTNNAPSARDYHTAVWTGSEMIVWGGEFGPPETSLDTGARYNPGTNDWTATSIAGAAHARDHHTAAWAGSEMIVWAGGYWMGGNYIYLNTGGRYCAQLGPTPTPTVTPSATPTPTATATPIATPTHRPRPIPRARPSPAPRPQRDSFERAR